ncbi:NADH-quinone oxidoreductase subunit NuoE [candidate division NPL-UPA2 bacterium]|nr:NADH-quinone oxidoreductase subunit NuoE [candidate division NPL-UPA2 bacterium]
MEKREERLLREILSFYKGRRSELIPILLRVQANFGYLPERARRLIASFLNITEGEVYSVASFYAQLRLLPLGRQRVTVCRGTACHIRGAPQILREIEKAIGIKEGETTADLEYTLETVACIGCCALAPCLRINRDVHGEMTPEKVREIPALNKGEQDGQ